ncbi:hypothetical protein HK102_002866 [Quaeritorhiza haematococci]|nr:hypothetical protein HK102_002866 [Quaeritorhiza haematococci]
MKTFISGVFLLMGILQLASVGVTAQPEAARAEEWDAGRDCGTRDFNDRDFENERRLRDATVSAASLKTSVTIDVHFHVINRGASIENGDLPQQMIDDQIRVLNNDFAQTPFTFQLASVDRTTRPEWFTLTKESNEEKDMKRMLRKGGSRTLNVYTTNMAMLGWATFPQDYAGDPTDDGVVVLYSSLPGGAKERFNLGKTLTHEVGHWLGLWHTFTGGCSYSNDGVEDTVAQKTPTRGCPIGQRTCKRDDFPRDQQHIFDRFDALATQDPIHNFMDYSDDACLNEFTRGQVEKMKAAWMEFRQDDRMIVPPRLEIEPSLA